MKECDISDTKLPAGTTPKRVGSCDQCTGTRLQEAVDSKQREREREREGEREREREGETCMYV